MPRYQPIVIVAAALCVGIACDYWRPLPAPVWFCLAAVGWCGWLVLWLRRHHAAAQAAVLLCVASLGGARHHVRWYLFDRDELGRCAQEQPQPVCLEAVAHSGPRSVPAPPLDPLRAIAAGDRSRLEVQVIRVRDGKRWRPSTGRSLLLVEGHLLGVHAGDRLRIFCQLSAPQAAHNPGEFDFGWHARGDGRLSQLSAESPDCIQVIARAGRWSLARALEEVRSRADQRLWRRLSHERSGLAAALLLGAREELAEDTRAAFAKTGTIHILSISGLHVGILAWALFGAMRLGAVRRSYALASISLITLSYAWLIDAEPPAVRATILVLLICASLYWSRRLLAFNALALAAVLVLAMNPADLFRVGPQLSFLAVGTLAWFGPRIARRPNLDPLQRLIERTRPWPERALRWLGRWTWRAFWLTALVWGISAPLVMAHFHLFSPATLLLTPLLTLPVAVGLICGFGVLVLDWFAPPLGVACGWVCDQCLWMIGQAVEIASTLPGSHCWAPGPDGWWLAGFYGVLVAWAVSASLRPPRRWCLALATAWLIVGLLPPLVRAANDRPLECTFLSVGHGCSVVLELPDGRTLLYDAGRLGSPEAGARSISSYLWSRGIMHLDAVVVSHADVDHFNAVPKLLEKFSVGALYVSPVMLKSESEAAAVLLAAIRAAQVPLREIWAGDLMLAGDACRIEVLHPTQRGVAGSDNANSIVLAIECQGRRILLTGDLESPGMEEVLGELPYDCDVTLAPHHGSANSNPPGFVAWSTPEWVVISGGHGRDLTPVEHAYQVGGAQVLHTQSSGAVHVVIDAGRLWVDCFADRKERSAWEP